MVSQLQENGIKHQANAQSWHIFQRDSKKSKRRVIKISGLNSFGNISGGNTCNNYLPDATAKIEKNKKIISLPILPTVSTPSQKIRYRQRKTIRSLSRRDYPKDRGKNKIVICSSILIMLNYYFYSIIFWNLSLINGFIGLLFFINVNDLACGNLFLADGTLRLVHGLPACPTHYQMLAVKKE